jgi:poly(beta-D-mannuronate) lyase
MAAGGDLASWSNTSGTHTMVIREAFTHLPDAKPEVVGGQIHDASDDVIEIRLEGSHLFVENDGKAVGDLDNNYKLGTPVTIKIEAANKRIKVFYNDELKVNFAKSGSGWYFKAGCYTQSNTSKGDSADAYGQVIIYSLSVSHS